MPTLKIKSIKTLFRLDSEGSLEKIELAGEEIEAYPIEERVVKAENIATEIPEIAQDIAEYNQSQIEEVNTSQMIPGEEVYLCQKKIVE